MKDETILKLAIEKAVKNGYKLPKGLDNLKLDIEYIVAYVPYEMIIFNHDFAKCFFGETMMPLYFNDEPLYWVGWGNGHQYTPHLPAWQYHLQQMVLCKNPLKYIEKYNL